MGNPKSYVYGKRPMAIMIKKGLSWDPLIGCSWCGVPGVPSDKWRLLAVDVFILRRWVCVRHLVKQSNITDVVKYATLQHSFTYSSVKWWNNMIIHNNTNVNEWWADTKTSANPITNKLSSICEMYRVNMTLGDLCAALRIGVLIHGLSILRHNIWLRYHWCN